MKVLLLNQTFYPDLVSTAQHLNDLAVALAEAGHRVTVLTSRRGYDNPERVFAAREHWRGVEICRLSSTRFGKSAKWRRAADFASFLVNCGAHLALLSRQDAVVALTSPPLVSFFGACFTHFRGGRFYYWIMDLNPDEAVAAGWLKSTSLACRILERLSRFSLRQATRAIALDRFMQDRLTAKGISPDRIVVIPPWSHDDVVRFDPSGRNRFREAHGLGHRFVVMYSGNHSPCHPLDTLLEAARRLDNEPITFCFVGGGSEFRKVQDFAHKHHLGNIRCLPYQPLTDLSASLSAADAQVIVMGDPFVGIIHPCKLYNVLNVGAPILYIGPRSSHITEALESAPGASRWTQARHGDVDQVVRNIQQLRDSASRAARQSPDSLVAAFRKETLLPRLVATIAEAPRHARVPGP